MTFFPTNLLRLWLMQCPLDWRYPSLWTTWQPHPWLQLALCGLLDGCSQIEICSKLCWDLFLATMLSYACLCLVALIVGSLYGWRHFHFEALVFGGIYVSLYNTASASTASLLQRHCSHHYPSRINYFGKVALTKLWTFSTKYNECHFCSFHKAFTKIIGWYFWYTDQKYV